MKTKTIILLLLTMGLARVGAQDQNPQEAWSLTDCIDYALEQNIQVQQSELTNLSKQVNLELAEAQKLPSLSASVRQNFSWANSTDETSGETAFSGSNNSSYSLSSSVVLYNGSKLNKQVEQAEVDLQSSKYDSETVKESLTLSILAAYLDVLYSEENVKNLQNQLDATAEQLEYSKERLNLGIISSADYLQVKSQLATEKLSLANANSQLSIARVYLMQLMELPLSDDFSIEKPAPGELVNKNIIPDAAEVYHTALGIKPQVQSVLLQQESAAIDEKIATAGYLPTLSADAGLGTLYNVQYGSSYLTQLGDQFSPSLGLSLSIPIFQKKQTKSNVALAKISYQNAELQVIDTKNQLRKEIEQVCVDVNTSQTEYEASVEQYSSNQESYKLAEEKFNNGLINSVDFLFEKTNMIEAESQLLQSKYQLVFNYKILDFYTGTPITL